MPMKKVEITAYGAPEEIADCVEAPDVGAPGPGEIVFDVLAFPINPADLSMCRGNYRLRPPLPATPGAECVGRVAAVGIGVGGIKPGDIVINLQRENWTQRRRIDAKDAIPLPAGLDLDQAAMLRINPATALLLLEDHVAPKPGEWVIQNVANSAVGRHLIVLAKQKGLRTANVVRRDDVAAELKSLGADVVLVDGDDLAARALDAVGGAPIRLGIDAVSGTACKRIADSVADGAVVVSYGAIGRGPRHEPAGAELSRGQPDGVQSWPWPSQAQPAAGARALCRSRDQTARRRLESADRGDLPDRGHQAGPDARPARRPQRQGSGLAERAARCQLEHARKSPYGAPKEEGHVPQRSPLRCRRRAA
jgi:NADPH:quinone reductase-like Zn-dependent oxidoreductase